MVLGCFLILFMGAPHLVAQGKLFCFCTMCATGKCITEFHASLSWCQTQDGKTKENGLQNFY